MRIEAYIKSVLCRYCKGKGCERCGYTGASAKGKKLLKAATFGIK